MGRAGGGVGAGAHWCPRLQPPHPHTPAVAPTLTLGHTRGELSLIDLTRGSNLNPVHWSPGPRGGVPEKSLVTFVARREDVTRVTLERSQIAPQSFFLVTDGPLA